MWQYGELMASKRKGEMTDDEASAKIAAGMKGMYTRRQVHSAVDRHWAVPTMLLPGLSARWYVLCCR